MKKLMNLKGIKVLEKNKQKSLKGGNWGNIRVACHQNARICCMVFNGITTCEPGICQSNGHCMWF